MNTRVIGNVSEAKALAAFIEAGYLVCKPFGDGHPYDLIIDDGEHLLRVQCKTARLSNGVIVIPTKSNNGRWYRSGESRGYDGKADLFAAFCPETGKVYVTPTANIRPGTIHLRVAPAVNNQARRIRWAHEYELQPLK